MAETRIPKADALTADEMDHMCHAVMAIIRAHGFHSRQFVFVVEEMFFGLSTANCVLDGMSKDDTKKLLHDTVESVFERHWEQASEAVVQEAAERASFPLPAENEEGDSLADLKGRTIQ